MLLGTDKESRDDEGSDTTPKTGNAAKGVANTDNAAKERPKTGDLQSGNDMLQAALTFM